MKIGFEEFGRDVTESRVKPFFVMDLLDEMSNALLGVGEVLILRQRHLLGLESLHPVFNKSVVIRIALATHIDGDPEFD